MFEDWSVDADQADEHETAAQTPVARRTDAFDQRVVETLAAHQGRAGICPRIPRLAALLGVHVSTVQRSLRRLEAAGRVATVPVYEQDDDPQWKQRLAAGFTGERARRQTSNTYLLPAPGSSRFPQTAGQTPVAADFVRPLEEKEQPASEERRVSSSEVSSPLTVVEVGRQHPPDQLDHDPTRSEVLATLRAGFGEVDVIGPPRWEGRRPVYRPHKGARLLPLTRNLADFHAAVDALDQDTVPESYAAKVNGRRRR